MGKKTLSEDVVAFSDKNEENEEEIVPPGFRFHPTDEELVGFYLLRKVEGKSISLELIRQVDIYKYDPWDLPKFSSCAGEKEWYFFCMRGRKYRNSVRPNRVTLTGTGFWKATGIDKPIYSSICNNKCIGLKKSLVYYRGNAGKGTKTDWMMHEFRFPPSASSSNSSISNQEAEVWTLCRILKRTISYKKFTPNNKTNMGNANSRTHSLEYSTESIGKKHIDLKGKDVTKNNLQEITSHIYNIPEEISIVGSPITSSSSGLWTANSDEFFRNGNWDELGSVIGFHTV
ncbi:hypothetical protein DH2020_049954 [Rehmannia glutinosa]|uniref:NAC domain-containing protein n=1 Tax=Rehmannia glutinosa TaxID=99300 RepID=A0ABR0U1R6_REHGL